MAPPKSKSVGEGKGKAVATTPSKRTTRSMVRKTRSDTRRSGSASKLVSLDSSEKKKRKTQAKKGEPSKKIKKEEEEEEEVVEVKKEDESTEEEDVDAAAEEAEEAEEGEEDSEQKTIVIEHCKQCKSFKERAAKVKEGLEIAVPGIVVTVNPDKPRRGCFEIREEGGETFISLLDMKRPFTPMKELDMDKVIADIEEKIK